MCEKDPDCINSGTLILDTNFLDQVNRIVKEEMASYALEKSVDEQRQIFLKKTRKLLDYVGHCGNDQVFTSAKVYLDEIDITKIESALRTANTNFFDKLCMEEEFNRSLCGIYEDRIRIEELEQEEVQAFQEILSEDLSFADTSLVLLALKLSQDDDVIIITDDLALQTAIKDLLRNHELLLGGSRFSTDNLHYKGSLIFLKNLHSCCEMSNSRWMSTVWSFVKHQYRRFEEGKVSEDIYKLHMSYADPLLAQLNADCKAKREEDERRQSYQMFGVNDAGQN
jgi:hypothetical protein